MIEAAVLGIDGLLVESEEARARRAVVAALDDRSGAPCWTPTRGSAAGASASGSSPRLGPAGSVAPITRRMEQDRKPLAVLAGGGTAAVRALAAASPSRSRPRHRRGCTSSRPTGCSTAAASGRPPPPTRASTASPPPTGSGWRKGAAAVDLGDSQPGIGAAAAGPRTFAVPDPACPPSPEASGFADLFLTPLEPFRPAALGSW